LANAIPAARIHEDSCGRKGIDETPQCDKHEEAQQPPAESECIRAAAGQVTCTIISAINVEVTSQLTSTAKIEPTIIFDGASGYFPSLNVYDMILFYVKKKSYLLTSRRYFPGNNAKFYNFQVGSYFDTV